MNELAILAAEVGVHERTLRRSLDQGTLRGYRPTPRSLELPVSERQFIRRSWGLLSALRKALRTESNLRFALLFGSTARGTDTRASDVDLLVDLRDSGFERVVDLSTKLTALVRRPVEVVRLQDAEAEPSLLADAVADGRVLVDRDNQWSRLCGEGRTLDRRGRRMETGRTEAALAGIDRLLA